MHDGLPLAARLGRCNLTGHQHPTLLKIPQRSYKSKIRTDEPDAVHLVHLVLRTRANPFQLGPVACTPSTARASSLVAETQVSTDPRLPRLSLSPSTDSPSCDSLLGSLKSSPCHNVGFAIPSQGVTCQFCVFCIIIHIRCRVFQLHLFIGRRYTSQSRLLDKDQMSILAKFSHVTILFIC